MFKEIINYKIGNTININRKSKFIKKIKIGSDVFWIVKNGRTKMVFPLGTYKKLTKEEYN